MVPSFSAKSRRDKLVRALLKELTGSFVLVTNG